MARRLPADRQWGKAFFIPAVPLFYLDLLVWAGSAASPDVRPPSPAISCLPRHICLECQLLSALHSVLAEGIKPNTLLQTLWSLGALACCSEDYTIWGFLCAAGSDLNYRRAGYSRQAAAAAGSEGARLGGHGKLCVRLLLVHVRRQRAGVHTGRPSLMSGGCHFHCRFQ